MGLSAWPFSLYRRCRPCSRTSTAPTARSTRRCLDTWGWASPSRRTRSFTGRSPPARTSRICRRRGSAPALKASAVVAARAMRASYTYIDICQAADTIADVERAVHDRGGWPSDTAIDRSEHSLADWEVLMDAIVGALGQHGVMNVDELRRAIESMEPAAYTSATYYERWLYAAETVLAEKGVVSAGELDGML